MEPQTINNFGVLPDPRPETQKSLDRVAGSENSIPLWKRTNNWLSFLPNGIPQSIPGKYDTMSCVSFGIPQGYESLMNFDLESYTPEFKDWLTSNGYINNGKVEVSEQFTAITSETTIYGNYFWKVFEAVRKFGLIPRKDLPGTLSNYSSTAGYLSETITPEMYAKGKEFTKRFMAMYQLVNGYDGQGGFTKLELAKSLEALDYSPLVINEPGHCTLMYMIRPSDYDTLDHYAPYLRTKDAVQVPVYLAYQINITPITQPAKPAINLHRDLMVGSQGFDVKQLQNMLKYEGFFSKTTDSTGYFGEITKQAVIKFQEHYKDEILKPLGLSHSTGYVGQSTRTWLEKHYASQ